MEVLGGSAHKLLCFAMYCPAACSKSCENSGFIYDFFGVICWWLEEKSGRKYFFLNVFCVDTNRFGFVCLLFFTHFSLG